MKAAKSCQRHEHCVCGRAQTGGGTSPRLPYMWRFIMKWSQQQKDLQAYSSGLKMGHPTGKRANEGILPSEKDPRAPYWRSGPHRNSTGREALSTLGQLLSGTGRGGHTCSALCLVGEEVEKRSSPGPTAHSALLFTSESQCCAPTRGEMVTGAGDAAGCQWDFAFSSSCLPSC